MCVRGSFPCSPRRMTLLPLASCRMGTRLKGNGRSEMAPRERRGGEGRERERVTHGVMLLATTMHPCTDLHGQGRESCGIGSR